MLLCFKYADMSNVCMYACMHSLSGIGYICSHMHTYIHLLFKKHIYVIHTYIHTYIYVLLVVGSLLCPWVCYPDLCEGRRGQGLAAILSIHFHFHFQAAGQGDHRQNVRRVRCAVVRNPNLTLTLTLSYLTT